MKIVCGESSDRCLEFTSESNLSRTLGSKSRGVFHEGFDESRCLKMVALISPRQVSKVAHEPTTSRSASFRDPDLPGRLTKKHMSTADTLRTQVLSI